MVSEPNIFIRHLQHCFAQLNIELILADERVVFIAVQI